MAIRSAHEGPAGVKFDGRAFPPDNDEQQALQEGKHMNGICGDWYVAMEDETPQSIAWRLCNMPTAQQLVDLNVAAFPALKQTSRLRANTRLFLGAGCGGKAAVERALGVAYTGDVREGIPNGHGTYTYGDGTRFEGDMCDGMPHGNGLYAWPNGNAYQGQCCKDFMHGQGTFVFVSNSRHAMFPTKRRFAAGLSAARLSGRGRRRAF